MSEKKRGTWSGSAGFVLAAAGSAIGLGNIWKFPYITGVNGGGAFVLIYLICITLVGIPIFLAELHIGQSAHANAVRAFEAVYKPRTRWRWVGFLGMLSGFLILSFYSVVGGWVLDFLYRSALNEFSQLPESEIRGALGELFKHYDVQTFCHFIFMSLTVGVVFGGIQKGLEKWNNILMPALFVLLFLLLAYALTLPGFWKAFEFLFRPDFSKITGKGILEAVGHSFFTLSIGLSCIITYGSYLKEDKNLFGITLKVAALDTLIALIAGVVIFAIVFSYGIEPGSGPSLLFQTLPVLFSQIPGGYFVSVAFFLLVGFAALTSAISLLEVVVAYIVETTPLNRHFATILTGTIIFLFGIPSVLSFNLLSEFHILGKTFFDFLDKITSSLSLPLGGLFISLFYGWVLGPKAVDHSLGRKNHPLAVPLLWITRVAAPVAILIILVNGLRDW